MLYVDMCDDDDDIAPLYLYVCLSITPNRVRFESILSVEFGSFQDKENVFKEWENFVTYSQTSSLFLLCAMLEEHAAMYAN